MTWIPKLKFKVFKLAERLRGTFISSDPEKNKANVEIRGCVKIGWQCLQNQSLRKMF